MNKSENKQSFFVNHGIKIPRILCIDAAGVSLGEMDTRAAITAAKAAGLDLVQISPPRNGKPPTCKMMDFGKYKYDLSKKEKEQNRKQRESNVDTKEIKFSGMTDTNDLRLKAEQAAKFLREGNRVKVTVKLKGRLKNNAAFVINDGPVKEFLGIGEVINEGNINYSEGVVSFFLKLKA